MTAGSHKKVVLKCAESLGIGPLLCGQMTIEHSCLDIFSSTSRQKCKKGKRSRESGMRDEEETFNCNIVFFSPAVLTWLCLMTRHLLSLCSRRKKEELSFCRI